MSREVRRVPADWEHPKDDLGRFQPMFDRSHADAVRQWEEEELPEWIEGERLWREEGKVKLYSGEIKTIEQVVAEAAEYRRSSNPTYDWWAGARPERPDPKWFMPDWPEAERTHYMMYEDTSEGTPISPAFATPEELARWLADTGASSFAGCTASYEGWLRVARGGFAPSAVLEINSDGSARLISGVEEMAREP